MRRATGVAWKLISYSPWSAILLLRDLRDLHVRYAEASIAYVMLGQAAQAAGDRDLLDACTHCHDRTLRGLKWTVTEIKLSAPQALISPGTVRGAWRDTRAGNASDTERQGGELGEDRVRQVGERLVLSIEGAKWLDEPSYKLEHVLELTLNLLGDRTKRFRRLLHGTWYGHPLHPVLTDLPIGSWSVSLLLDGLSLANPQDDGLAAGADLALAVGVAGALAAALTGLNDWQHTHDTARRTGLVHGLINIGGTSINVASLVLRRRGRRAAATGMSVGAWGGMLVSAYLGGTLVYRHRIGVDHAHMGLEPRRFVPVLDAAELPDNDPRCVQVDGAQLVLVRQGDEIHALGGECPHLGGPLWEGWLYRGGIVCPWHGSRFSLCDGEAIDGPATAPLPLYDVRVRDGRIEVRHRPRVRTAPPGDALVRLQENDDES